MDFDLACAITQPAAAHAALERRRLQRELDGWTEARRLELGARFSLAEGEFEADASALDALAHVVTEAARRIRSALDVVAAAGLAAPLRAVAPTIEDIAASIEDGLDGALEPSAARVLGAAICAELAS